MASAPEATMLPTMSNRRERATAFHEAGHVLVALHLGIPINGVTIVENEDAFGGVIHPSPLGLSGCESASECRRAARDMILVAYAGFHAQRLADPMAAPSAAEADRDNAFELSRTWGVLPRRMNHIGDDDHYRYLECLERESKRLVRRLRRSISAFASELLLCQTMSGDEVLRLLGEADRSDAS